MDISKFLLLISIVSIRGTIDVNLSELEYLAARLDLVECRRLVAALHYHSYELPESLKDAEDNIDEDIPCLRLLLHWNSRASEGLGESHELLERRLRQLGHRHLADWLGKTTFRELAKDLQRAISEPFVQVTTTTVKDNETNPLPTTAANATLEKIDDDDDDDDYDWSNDDFWVVIEMLMIGLFCLLLFTLILVAGALVIDKFAWCDDDDDDEEVSVDNQKLILIN